MRARAAVIANGVVENIIVVIQERCTENVVNIDDLPVNIGDTYDGEFFYRNGEKVQSEIDEYAEALRILGVEV